jgi:AmmeMemoRadiSam system protein A
MMLDASERTTLLQLARRSIEACARAQPEPELPQATGGLARCAAAFVSIHRLFQGREGLRGCIGNFESSTPLLLNVREMAWAAASRDPRFAPVHADELSSLRVAISVLDQPSPVTALDEIEVGTHGLIISSGARRGVLLAKVPVEQGWDRHTFLQHLCLKAGLREDIWRRFGVDSTVQLHKFEELDFAEPVN